MIKIIATLLIPLFAIPSFLDYTPQKAPSYTRPELFDPSLSRLNSVATLEQYADSLSRVRHIQVGTLPYGLVVANILRNRFYHGFSTYSLRENWIASLSQTLLGHGLGNPVIADDILKYPYAGCSQQAIVLMKVMKDKGVPYRSVGFPHHYATELYFNRNWYYFDPDMEPTISPRQRMEKNWKDSADYIKKYYRIGASTIDWALGNNLPAQLGAVNANPAPRAQLFQEVTKYLSKILWILPFVFLMGFYLRGKPSR